MSASFVCACSQRAADVAAPPQVLSNLVARAVGLAVAVFPSLYVGPFLYAKSLSWLRRHGITHIVNATPCAPCMHEEDGIAYLRVAIDDSPAVPISEHFEASRAFIVAALASGGTVLVHCQMGRSRSVTLAAAYLMAEHGLDWRAALVAVQRARPSAAPNTGFMRQLKQYSPRTPSTPLTCFATHGDDPSMCCSCHETAAMRGLRFCSVCVSGDDDDAPLPSRARFDAFADMLQSGVDEIAFVPGPLHAGLFDEADAAGGVQTAPLAPVEVGMISGARRLAIDVKALPLLFAECHAAWRAARVLGARPATFAASVGAESASYSAEDDSIDRSTRCVLLLTVGQSYTAWSDRKRRLLRMLEEGSHATGASESSRADARRQSLRSELAFSDVVLRSFAKSHESFSHRRWLLHLCIREGGLSSDGGGFESGAQSTAQSTAQGTAQSTAQSDTGAAGLNWFATTQAGLESSLCADAMERRKANYHAARHVVEACTARLGLIAKLSVPRDERGVTRDAGMGDAVEAALRDELARTRAAAARNLSDASVFHARRAALSASVGTLDVATPAATNDMHAEELRWVDAQIRRAPWHEVLWHHRRWLLSRGGAWTPGDTDRGGALFDLEDAALRYATDAQRAAALRCAALHDRRQLQAATVHIPGAVAAVD